MSVASRSRSLTIRKILRERAPMRGRTDRAAGVIYGVKVVGRSSPNTHGVRGVNGTEYTYEALQEAAPLYEGINCNVDHPPRAHPDKERSAKDRFAWLENIEVRESGIYGDLHFLDPTDPLAVKMLNAAEAKPDAYALSHNAVGRGEIRGDKYVVTAIPEVNSVDIVADGGTNRSLFESRTMPKVRVCEVLKNKVMAALSAGRKKRLESLLSTCLTEARSPLMEASEDGKDHRDHMYTAMRACEDAGNDEAATGIHKLLHPDKRVEEEEETEKEKEKAEEEEDGEGDERKEMEGQGEEGPGEPGEHNEGPDGGEGPGAAMEGRRRKKQPAGREIGLTESRALAMCRTAGVEATADVMEAIKGAGFEQAMAVINLAKRSQTRLREASPPRSSGPLGRGLDAAPIPKNLKDWAESLKG